jgi:hypothetical protein
MSDMQTISSFLSSLTVVSKFIRDSIEKIKDNAVREKVEELLNAIIPLQTHIITLQAMNSTSIKEKEALETKLREIEDWNKKAKGYTPYEITPRVIVYMKQSQGKESRPFMYFCPNCFDIHHKLSIVQLERESAAGASFFCPNQPACQFKFIIPSPHKFHPQEPPSALGYT